MRAIDLRILSCVGLLLMLLLTGSCSVGDNSGRVIYRCDAFTVYADSVRQADYVVSVSGNRLVSRNPSRVVWQPGPGSGDYPLVQCGGSALADAVCDMAFERIEMMDAGDVDLYSVYMAASVVSPELSKRLLRRCVRNGRITMDMASDTVAVWPVCSDRALWVVAAVEVYRLTGDKDWLKEIYPIARRALSEDMRVIFDDRMELVSGVPQYVFDASQSFLPQWMNLGDVYGCRSLTVNILMAEALESMALTVSALGIDDDVDYFSVARSIARAVNDRLWIPDKACYSAYLYGGHYPVQLMASDNLGQALAVISGVASDDMACRLITGTPLSDWGVPLLSPVKDGVGPFYEVAIWPVTQACWCMAARRVGNANALSMGMAALIRAAVAKERPCNPVPLAAVILRAMAGMSFDENGISFHPCMPPEWSGSLAITGLRYRNAVLDIEIFGTGTSVASFAIDGVPEWSNSFSATLGGHHSVSIVMGDNAPECNDVNVSDGRSLAEAPQVRWNGRVAEIENARDGDMFDVIVNGAVDEKFSGSAFEAVPPAGYTALSIARVSDGGVGMASRPHDYFPGGSVDYIGIPDMLPVVPDTLSLSDFVELSARRNAKFEFVFNAPGRGRYLMDVCYMAADTLPARCAVASVEVNGSGAGTFVMPCGRGDVAASGFSNMVEVEMSKGPNHVIVVYDRIFNINVPATSNSASVGYLRIIKK